MVESAAPGAVSPTLRKFGAPDSTLRDYGHWSILLRPQQATLGAMVLIAREPVTALPQLSVAAFAELRQASSELEQALKRAFGYDKINYLMLMMVDPDVHFHVFPRYAGARRFAGHEFTDPSWPGPPRLDLVNATGATLNTELRAELLRCWPN